MTAPGRSWAAASSRMQPRQGVRPHVGLALLAVGFGLERLFYRWALRREQLGAVLGDVHVVLEPHAELPLDVNPRLVAEHHSRLQRQRLLPPEHVVLHQVRPLVSVHAHAVAEAMREVLEAGAVPVVHDDLAPRGVDRLERHARFRGLERRRLRLMDDVEDLLHLVGGLAEHEGPRDVGLVSFDGASVVDHDDRAFADRLRRDRSVGKRRVLADLNAREAGEAKLAVAGVDQAADVVLRHAGLQRLEHGFVAFQRRLGRDLHQLELVRALDHPARGDDRRRADDLHRRRRTRDAVREHELRRLLDADPAARDPALLQAAGDALERALVLLPDGDVGVLDRSAGQLLPRAVFLERRRHDVRIADFRDDDRGQPFAVAPPDAGEVVERRAPCEDDRVDLLLDHQAARFLEPRLPLVGGDRLREGAHRRQRGDARRQRRNRRIGAAAALCRERRRGQPGCRAGQPHETASADHRNSRIWLTATAAPLTAGCCGGAGWASSAWTASAQRPARKSSCEMYRQRNIPGISATNTSYSANRPRDVYSSAVPLATHSDTIPYPGLLTTTSAAATRS